MAQHHLYVVNIYLQETVQSKHIHEVVTVMYFQGVLKTNVGLPPGPVSVEVVVTLPDGPAS